MNPFDAARSAFRGRVSGDPTGAPDWVREIATVGTGDGWFDPDGVVWRVHGDLSTLVGGVAALLGQGAHPLALAGVQRHSAYREDPWKRLAGTARWLVVSTFGSAELAERESARVRGMHRRVKGTLDDGRAYSAGDPDLLRWVHLAFTDAFLAAQTAVGRDMSRFGPRWGDDYVREWARTARAAGRHRPADHPGRAGRGDLAATGRCWSRCPTTCWRSCRPRPGCRPPSGWSTPGSPAAPRGWSPPPSPRWPGCPGGGARSPRDRAQLLVTEAQLRALEPGAGLAQPERGGRPVAPGHRTRPGLGRLRWRGDRGRRQA